MLSYARLVDPMILHSTLTNAVVTGNRFKARLLEPGIVSYEDQKAGKVLLKQSTLSRCVNSFIGNPLILKHKRITKENRKQHELGEIDRVFYNSEDACWWCEGTVKGDRSKQAVRDIGLVSCAYVVNATGPGGKYHDIPYNEEITDFSGEHLAIVDNPRYEEARIFLNSKTKQPMSMFKWFKKKPASVAAAPTEETKVEVKTVENSTASAEDISADTEIQIDEAGTKTTLGELVANARTSVSGDDEFEVDGQKVTLNALLASQAELATLKAQSVENAKKEAGKGHFYRLTNAASRPSNDGVDRSAPLDTPDERLARGRAQWGSAKK